MKKKPNIVFITIDSLRADYCGHINHKEKNTPHIDKIAKKSAVFSKAIVPSFPTFFCFSSLFTGKIPFHYGEFLGIPKNNTVKTMAQRFKKNGYSTCSFIADNPALYPSYGYVKGFDQYNIIECAYNYVETASRQIRSLLYKSAKAITKSDNARASKQGGQLTTRQSTLIRIFNFVHSLLYIFVKARPPFPIAEVLNREVMKAFRKRKRKPFFLWIHYMDTHTPYYSGWNMFAYGKNRFQNMLAKLFLFRNLSFYVRDMKIKNKKALAITKESYRSCVGYVDRHVGDIVDYLKNKHPNTIFVITSDHGEAFMEHGIFWHEPFHIHNEALHVPLIIHFPNDWKKQVMSTTSLVSLGDALLKINVNKKSSFGVQVVRCMKNHSLNNISVVLYRCRAPHRFIHDNATKIEGYQKMFSYQTEEYKYIQYDNGKGRKLFHLISDPKEQKDISRSKKHAKTMKRLSTNLASSLKKATQASYEIN